MFYVEPSCDVLFFSPAEERESGSGEHPGTRTGVISQQTLEEDG